jgi:hypothetical protein
MLPRRATWPGSSTSGVASYPWSVTQRRRSSWDRRSPTLRSRTDACSRSGGMTICINPCAGVTNIGASSAGAGRESKSSSAARSVAVSRSNGSCSYGSASGAGQSTTVRFETYSAIAEARVSARSAREAAMRIGPEWREMAAAARAALAETGRSGMTIDCRSRTAIASATPGSSSRWSMRCEKAMNLRAGSITVSSRTPRCYPRPANLPRRRDPT